MARDPLKDDYYFEKFIQAETARIEKYSNAIETVIRQRGEQDDGVRVGYIILTGYHFSKLSALYSSGRPIEEIRDFLPEVIRMMEKSWNGENYEKMLWMLSIGVMLDLEDERFERLVGLVRKYDCRDGLLEFLIQGKQRGDMVFHDLPHRYPYDKLTEAIQGDDRLEQVEKLKLYLVKHWYNGHRDSGWHDSHKHRDPIYSGYWSFESGAVAKILGLDHDRLKGIPYYPFDMVQYNN